jgi:hypothetical protein
MNFLLLAMFVSKENTVTGAGNSACSAAAGLSRCFLYEHLVAEPALDRREIFAHQTDTLMAQVRGQK